MISRVVFSKRFKAQMSPLQFLLQHRFLLLFIRKSLSWDEETLALFSKLANYAFL